MSRDTFKLKPVKRYHGARYYSEMGLTLQARACWLSTIVPARLARGAVTLLLAAGLAFGGMGCEGKLIEEVEPDGDLPPVNNGVCEEGEVRCNDETTVGVCRDGRFRFLTCNKYCSKFVSDEYTSQTNRCSESDPENLCSCGFDFTIGDGEPVMCRTGDIICHEEQTIGICDNRNFYQYTDCGQYCEDNFGKGFCPTVCKADQPDNLCGCRYNITDGTAQECAPGSIRCMDDHYGNKDWVGICVEGHYQYQKCKSYCIETFDPGWYPRDCDADKPDDFCGCHQKTAPDGDEDTGTNLDGDADTELEDETDLDAEAGSEEDRDTQSEAGEL